MTPARDRGLRWTRFTEPTIAGILIFGNLFGGLLNFGYFRFIDVSPSAFSGRLRPVEVLFFAGEFAVAGAIGLAVSRRWQRPLKAWVAGAPMSAAQRTLARRRSLRLPYTMASLTFGGWALAGLSWGVLWPLLRGAFSLANSLRTVFGITVIGGSVTAAFIFFAVEHAWRRRLPLFFPAGDVSAVAGVRRLRVRTRLTVIFLLVGVLPLSLLGVISYTRAAELLRDGAAAAGLLDSMLLFIAFMLAVGTLTAVGLSVFVARSVAGPLGDLETAMHQVADGNLDARCPVVSNDELGAVAEGFNRMVDGLRERERIRETFGKYVAREVRDEILAGRVELEGQAREVTMLFSDLRDFTPWVESHDPREVVRDLNAYFTLMEAAVREHGGLVLQYIGDEIEAVFGAPLAQPRHPEMALRAALSMRARLAAWNADRARAGKPPLRHGIGIHTGRVLAASIGSPDRLAYTLVGDAVNLASRIQGLTKDFAADILVSADSVRLIESAFDLEPLPAATVKGRAAAAEVYRVP